MRRVLSIIVFLLFYRLQSVLAQVQTGSGPSPDEMTDIMDIYGPMALPYTSVWFYVLITSALLLSVAALLFFFSRRKKTRPAVLVPPHKQALTELNRADHLIDHDQSLLYGEKVSEILRWYLEKRFAVHSTRQTTREFLESLASLPQHQQTLLLAHQQALQNCLEQCDLAKYAHKKSARETMQQLKDRVARFIEETMQETEEKEKM